MSTQVIAEQFLPEGSFAELYPYGNGLINDTYLVRSDSGQFILQKINRVVFPDPGRVMENLEVLFTHIQVQPVSSIKLKFPDIIKTQAGELCHIDEDSGYWRALSFIENTKSFETIESQVNAEQTGFALGHFHRLLSNLDPATLHDTLPGFHITPGYLNHYHQVMAIPNPLPRKQLRESRTCQDFIRSHQHLADGLEKAKQRGLLPQRVTHGDPKLNNILFDNDNKQAVSIIDLDTVKPGLIHYDIGDCLRSCCNTAKEESLSAHFDMDIFAAIMKSYLAETKTFFSEFDYDYLFIAIQLIPFELGLRFYTDYLEGNRYFKVNEPDQNLQRALAQFQLLKSIERQRSHIQQLIQHLRYL